jgi:hypothetical protein
MISFDLICAQNILTPQIEPNQNGGVESGPELYRKIGELFDTIYAAGKEKDALEDGEEKFITHNHFFKFLKEKLEKELPEPDEDFLRFASKFLQGLCKNLLESNFACELIRFSS